MKWLATGTKDGRLDFGEYNSKKFRQYLKDNGPVRLEVTVLTPESKNQRRFFEGAIVPLIAYYQEGMHHRNADDLEKVRDWLKLEFNGQWISVASKALKIPRSTKGQLNRGFLDRVTDWMADQGYQTDVLDPGEYKKWRDTIYSSGGPDTYIDFLLSTGRLR